MRRKGAAPCKSDLVSSALAKTDSRSPVGVGTRSKTIRKPAGDGPGRAAAGRGATPPLPGPLPDSGELSLRRAALFIPSSPTHDGEADDDSLHGRHPLQPPLGGKREDVEEPAGLAAVAEIAALECALAEKERRLKAQKSKETAAAAGGGGGSGAAAPLLPAKRKSAEDAGAAVAVVGQPLDVAAAGPVAAVGAHAAPPPPLAAVRPTAAAGVPPPLLRPPGALPLGAGAAPVVGVPVQQAEALRAQQLQLQATILAQAQGQVEEVATSVGEIGSAHRHDDDAVDGSGESAAGDGGSKKQRLVWTTELHNRFINAITHLGLKHAVPKNILTMMNVEGMTRENVASHLQKYRMYLKKIGGFSDKDKVDPDALQAIHEQNVQQMAAQQALQNSLAAMHGGYGYAYGTVSESPTSAQAAGAAAAAAAAAATGGAGATATGQPCGPPPPACMGAPAGYPPMFAGQGQAHPWPYSGQYGPAGPYPYPPFPYPPPTGWPAMPPPGQQPPGGQQAQQQQAQAPPPFPGPPGMAPPGHPPDPNNAWGWGGPVPPPPQQFQQPFAQQARGAPAHQQQHQLQQQQQQQQGGGGLTSSPLEGSDGNNGLHVA